MGRGFFKGHRPVMSSSSGMFARKGDPWVTEKEGQRDFGRTVEVENPDMDADRQRHNKIKQNFSKEFQDRVRRVDVKMTMREAVDTERSTRLDGYQAEKAGQAERDKIFKKPKSGQWPVKGKDFQAATVQRKLAAVAMRVKREIRALEGQKTTGIVSGRSVTGLSARVHDKANIACPYTCGYSSHDSRNISKHLRKHRNQCCTHPSSCNCRDCRDARNDF